MFSYKCLTQQNYKVKNYAIVPIRDEDKYLIMKWRNEQMYHLRQNELLTEADQEAYFNNVIKPSFTEIQPKQILFSYLQNDVCIGYGGLVHINWIDKHAEISFIIDPALEKDYFVQHWQTYLSLIEQVAFSDLCLHKIFTYAFDLRPKLYEALENAAFTKEAVLKEHSIWQNSFIDVIIHCKINTEIIIRTAKDSDKELYLQWANDALVRQQSFNSEPIEAADHYEWFDRTIKDENIYLYVFENHLGSPVGQVRLQKDVERNRAVIGISIDKQFRGKGLAAPLLERGVAEFRTSNNEIKVEAYIKKENSRSVNAFLKAGFEVEAELIYEGYQSILLLH